MAANRIQELNQLKDNVAGMNQKAAAQEKAALGMSVQKTLQQAPVGPGGAVAQAQTIAPQATQQASQIDLKAQAQTQQQQAKATEAQIQESAANFMQELKDKQRKLSEQIFKKELESGILVSDAEMAARERVVKSDLDSKKRMQAAGFHFDHSVNFASAEARESFQKVSQAAKSRFLDERLAFREEQGQLKLANEQQLFDFAVADARNVQEFEQKAQILDQITQTKLAGYQRAQDLLEMRLKEGWLNSEQKLDNKSRQEIIAAVTALKETQRREAARAKSRAQKRQAVGQFFGAALGVGVVLASGGTAAPALLGAAGTGSALGGAASFSI